MRFDIQNQSSKPARRRKPPNYFSNSVRVRLATLVVLTGLVLIAMNEAGKPETWEKLGFRSHPTERHDAVDAGMPVNESTPAQTPDKPLSSPVSHSDQFWLDVFHNSTQDERATLFAILKAVGEQQSLAEGLGDDASNLLTRITKKSEVFETFRTSASARNTVKHLIVGLSDATNGKAVGEQTRRCAVELQQLLDPPAYDLIEDRTSMNRSEEGLAWVRTWDRLSQIGKLDFKETSYLQLAGQPEAYRGKAVRLRGDVRGMELLASENADSGPYIILWIKPVDSNQTPYCVYVKELPDSFPLNSKVSMSGFVKLNQPVTVDGIFFKLRSYLAVNEKIEICPLILANTVELQTAVIPDTSFSWTPPAWLLVLFFVGMPVIAAWLAIVVYRSTTIPRPEPSGVAKKELEHSLTALANDSNVKTDLQRVQELYQNDRPDA